MAICIYDARADDFSTNGLSVLSPISCEIEENENDMFELALEHPIDKSNRWVQIREGAIIKAPVPARESPLYEEEVDDEGSADAQQRKIWEVARTTHGAYLRSGPGTSYKKLAIKRNGDQVIELEEMKAPWIKVCVVDGGAVGYMSKKWLDQVGTESVETGGAKPNKGSVLKIRQSREQLFRIYEVKRNSAKGTVTAKAMHIFYDLLGNIVGDTYEVENETAKSVMNGVAQKLINDHPFTFHTYAEGKVSGDFGYQNPIEIILDSENGIAKQIGANLFRDNFDVFLLPDVTRDLGVTIRRKKNSKGVQVTSSTADIVTRIIPEGKGKDDDVLHVNGPGYIDSPRIDDYPIVYTKRIEYDVQVVDKDPDGESTFKKESEAKARLEALAREDFEKHGVDLPTYSMDVDFVLLENSADFVENQNYGQLQAVHIGDTVRVIDSLIGVDARLRVTGYTWDAASSKPRYTKITLGDIQSLEQKVYNSNIAGGISGSKIAPESASGNILRDLSVQYAKISAAAIQQLNAGSITALTARIQEIVAGKLTTDELYAQFAEMFALKLSTLTAKDIETDSLAAALAAFTIVTAGTASFDRATIQHLVAEALNLQYGVAGTVFIKNLAVEYAQMIGAAIGNLCIKASDGNYYNIDVDRDGSVTATKTTVSAGEIAAGQTNGGQVILETNITAANLSTSNLIATYALVNRIDAARIDVDELFAREAFIDMLRTSRIFADKSLEIIVGEADSASRVFRQEDFPDGSVLVKPGDLLVQPSTGKQYQAVEAGNIAFALDENGNLHYDYDGDGSLSMDGFDLCADGFTLSLMEDGSVSVPYRWVLVRDLELQAQLNAQAEQMANTVLKINQDIADIQDQLDGNITTWFEDYIPTTSNAPASTWTTADLKNQHLGDLFYVNNTSLEENGYCYRWQQSGGTYGWVRVSDSGVTKALADAAKAQDTADGKRRVFVAQPTPPYDVGDLWAQGSSGDLMRCSTAKSAGQSYAAGDWVKASKYTDDTKANAAQNTANAAQNTANAAQSTANNAQSTANGAQETADMAGNYANEALDKANNALTQAEFKRIVRIDDEGLHVGDNLTGQELLLASGHMNVVIDGVNVATYADKFTRFGNMQIRKVRGGLAISVYRS